jgi:hypothetical protein
MSTRADSASARAELERYLAVLAGREPTGALLELRFRRGPNVPMRQRFYPAIRGRRVAETALWRGQRSDVYLGVAPRRRRAGGKAALKRAWVLWGYCDTPAARRRSSSPPAATVPATPTGRSNGRSTHSRPSAETGSSRPRSAPTSAPATPPASSGRRGR